VHNGYKAVGTLKAQLAELHQSCARLYADDRGLTPKWIVYHGNIVTGGRAFFSGVCPVEGAWVEPILPRLEEVDVRMLSGGATALAALQEKRDKEAREQAKVAEATRRRNDTAAVDAAKARYLERKKKAAK